MDTALMHQDFMHNVDLLLRVAVGLLFVIVVLLSIIAWDIHRFGDSD